MNALSMVLRWAGRLTAVGLAAFVATFVVGEGLPDPASDQEAVLTVLMFGAVAANVVGWLWPIPAACVSLGSGVAFVFLMLRAGGPLPGPWLLATLFLPGLLYVAAELANRGRRW